MDSGIIRAMKSMKDVLTWFAFGGAVLASLAGFAERERPVKFGCAYYPEAWPCENWERDLADMKELGLCGKAIGAALEALLALVIDEELPNEKDRLIAYTKEELL